jgi:hypothetical protein
MSGVVELTPDAAAVGAAVEDTQELEGLLLAAAVPKEDAT